MLVTENANGLVKKLKEEMDRIKNMKKINEKYYYEILKKIGEVEEELAAI